MIEQPSSCHPHPALSAYLLAYSSARLLQAVLHFESLRVDVSGTATHHSAEGQVQAIAFDQRHLSFGGLGGWRSSQRFINASLQYWARDVLNMN